MKLLKYILYFSFFVLSQSCSDDNLFDLNNQNENQTTNKEDNLGESYISFKLKMSGINGESSSLPIYKQGEDWENTIHDFMLLIFRSEKEIKTIEEQNEALLINYLYFDSETFNESDLIYISRKDEFLMKFDDFNEKYLNNSYDNRYFYYGLILANFDQSFYENNVIKTFSRGNTKFEYYYNTALTRRDLLINNEKISMSNIAYWNGNNQPPFQDPLLLVPFDFNEVKNTLYDDFEDIKNTIKPAAVFYLQKNCTKITINYINAVEDASYGNGLYPCIRVGSNVKMFLSPGAKLINENSYGNLLQHTETLKYEMENIFNIQGEPGVNRFHSNLGGNYDWVTWAEDNNYFEDQDHRYGDLLFDNNTNEFGSYSIYTFENTGEVNCMKKKYTTLVEFDLILCTQVMPGFYTIAPIIILPDNSFYSAYMLQELVDTEEFLWFQYKGNGEMETTLEECLPSNLYGNVDEQVASLFNLDVKTKIRLVTDPAYQVRIPIRHYDDSEFNEHLIDKDHVKYDAAHLGRYGIVRNHWYNINIYGFKGIDDFYVNPGNSFWQDGDDWDDPEVTGTDDGSGENPGGDRIPGIEYTINVVKWYGYQQIIDF